MTERTMKLAALFATLAQAKRNCDKSGNTEWSGKHADRAEALAREFMPSGSGFDSGTKFDIDASNETLLVFHTSYHHMTEHGMYDGWTEHVVRVSSTFTGFNLSIGGRNRNDIKEVIGQSFDHDLGQMIVETAEGFRRA